MYADLGHDGWTLKSMRISDSETSAGRDTVSRVALVLEAVSEHPLGIGLTDLTAATGMKKATVYRIAERLVAHHLLQQTVHGYQLGLRFFEWSRNVPVTRILRAAALPLMAQLASRTGLTVELAVYEGGDMVVVERIPGHVVDTSALPDRRPAAHTSTGLAILAFSSPKVVNGALASAEAAGRPVAPAILESELAVVRKNRVARDTGRYDRRWGAAAAPVVATAYLGTEDFPACAALCVIGPANTPHVDRATPLVRDAARQLSHELSTIPSHPDEEWPVPVVPRGT